MMKELVVVRGGGDLASGIIHKLFRCGYDVVALECGKPTAIRRKVAFSEAVNVGILELEGVVCQRCELSEVSEVLASHRVALLIDESGESIQQLKPRVVIDAILAKRNINTRMDMADIVIGVGLGFEAGQDVHAVVETKRGHDLGRIYFQGSAIPNTGIPGNIGGYTKERVIHAPYEGKLHNLVEIGDIVQAQQIIAYIDDQPVYATIQGVLRGILPEGFMVWKGLKMADIDPRIDEANHCDTISDKARCIAGGVLEAMMILKRKQDEGKGTLFID